MNKKFEVDILSARNFTSFGFCMSGRKFSTPSYRYAFNGKEKDEEWNEGSYDFGARMYDGRIGKFLSVDPYSWKFSHLSPYAFAANNPIYLIDKNGESYEVAYKNYKRVGNSVTMDVDIVVKIKVLNLSSTTIDMNKLKGSAQTYLNSVYNGEGGQTFDAMQTYDGKVLEKAESISITGKVNVKVEIEVITSLDQLQAGDDVAVIVDEVNQAGQGDEAGLMANHGVLLLEATYANDPKYSNSLIAHELGHELGMWHTTVTGAVMKGSLAENQNKIDYYSKGEILQEAYKDHAYNASQKKPESNINVNYKNRPTKANAIKAIKDNTKKK